MSHTHTVEFQNEALKQEALTSSKKGEKLENEVVKPEEASTSSKKHAEQFENEKLEKEALTSSKSGEKLENEKLKQDALNSSKKSDELEKATKQAALTSSKKGEKLGNEASTQELASIPSKNRMEKFENKKLKQEAVTSSKKGAKTSQLGKPMGSPWKFFEEPDARQLHQSWTRGMLNLSFWTPWFGPPDQLLLSRLFSSPFAGELPLIRKSDTDSNLVQSYISVDPGKAHII